MRIALLSDVHSNATALAAVFAHATEQRIDGACHLGDLVGYGPDPDEVVRILVEADARCVMGNHDAAVAGVIDLAHFNPLAAAAARWTMSTALPGTASYLRSLPTTAMEDGVTCAHGTLRDPIWEYLDSFDAARGHFARQETPLSAVGHTHVPLLIRCSDEDEITATLPDEGVTVSLPGDARWCINPGSVGQPRDGDPRASYAVLNVDERTVAFFRVPYDIAATQARMRAAQLPDPLIARLSIGH